MDDLSSANLSEAKRALLQKYLHGELTLKGARRINARAEQDQSALRPPSPRGPLRPLSPRLSSADLPVDPPVALMFEAQADRSPGAIAAVYENQALTYDALNRKANQLAHHLRKLGVGPETLVGLAVNRSLDMLIGALGILKAGGAYVPLDPAFPRERLRFMIDDARLAFFVTEEEIAAQLDQSDTELVKLDSDSDLIERESVENPISNLTSNNLAYLTYTSGSTGQPKGVQIEHRALTNFLCSMRREPGLTAADNLLSVTTLSFDISGLELFLPLICGASVVIAAREVTIDGRLLKDLIATSGATVMQATPATWRMLIDAGWTGSERLRVLCGGEALARDLANDLLTRCGELWNLYGPTETTIWSSLSKIESITGPITIGRPIANTYFHVLDENLNRLPSGETGELHIGGLGLARGYLNRPELTAERFIADSFADSPNARLYKTGDMARFLPDGSVEFLGRIDTQTKVRGFRIELGEIEAALTESGTVAQAVVIMREDQPGDQRLVAYLVARNGAQLDTRELRRQIQKQLPDQMVPSTIVQLDRMPLTSNAKINRKALPAPTEIHIHLTETLVPPRNHTQRSIARIWQEVLKLEEVGIHENFFDLGGNSLLAGSMLARLRDSFQVDLPMRAVFAAPTIAGLAREIDSREPEQLIPAATTSKSKTCRLSFPQERLWFLDQLNPGSAAFNIPLAARLTEPLDSAVLKRSIEEIVRRHEVLRMTFPTVNGEPRPVVSSATEVDLVLINLTAFPEAERETRARAIVNDETLRPFDLANGPLLRTTLVRLAETDHIFLLTMHHIASDGWSMVLFFNELSRLYDAFSRGEPSPLAGLPIQYADYAGWQRDWLAGEVTQRQISYWKEKLGGELPALDLPTDRPRPNLQTFHGARKWLVLTEAQTKAINELCRRERVTLFMTLLAAFKVLLNRYSGQEDIIVGAPIGARPLTETENLIGFFLNNLALRTDLSGNPTFRDALAQVRQTVLEAFANQDVPFEKLIEELRPPRNLSRTPIFQVYFNLLNFTEELSLPGANESISFVDAWSQSEENFSKFDLTFYAGIDERQLKLAMVYNVDLFDEIFIVRMLAHFESLLESILANPDRAISDFALEKFVGGSHSHPALAGCARKTIHTDNRFNGFVAPLKPLKRLIDRTTFERSEIEQSITSRFEQQVRKHPANTAIKGKHYDWSYAELDCIADRIGRSLVGLGPEAERVALLFEHDAPMIAAMLGALKAGKTYVPLDPNYPPERLSWILEHAQAGALLTNNRNLIAAQRLVSSGVRLINIDRLGAVDDEIDLPESGPDRLAYILYTSGSTGEPKGVMQNHRNVLHFIRVYTNNLRIGSEDRLTLLSSYCFDASVMDIFGALLNGATLYPIDIRRDGLANLAEKINEERITIYHSTPTVYRYFIETLGSAPAEGTGDGDWSASVLACNERDRAKNLTLASEDACAPVAARFGRRTPKWPHLRLIVLGGEEVNRHDVESYRKHFSDDCILVNGFGPTEATVALQNFIDKDTAISSESVAVGFPVEDTEVLLLSDRGTPVEIQGEIAIRSPHVALGYWRNPEATNAAFYVRSPTVREGPSVKSGALAYARASDTNALGEGQTDRIYRTGDLGRRLSDGSIRFEGRKDFQIKIRGFRVELGEIESVLSRHPQVRDCAVVVREVDGRDKQLVAYLAPQANQSPSEADLRNFLKQELPEYMLPAAFVTLDELPLTASGKVNRPALPAPTKLNREPAKTAAPQTTLEKLLLPIWIDILGVNLGIHDNFFEHGGHSLMAVRLFAQIENRLGHRLPLATLFQAPTIAQLAAILEGESTHQWTSLVPIQPEGDAPPFFCVHGLGGNVLEFYDLARHLGINQPFYGLQSQGLNGKQTLHTSIKEMAAHYIREMREVQPRGPYFIGGRSLGGTIAFEMACQLRAQGETVALLALLDAYPAGYAKLLPAVAQPETNFGRAANRIESHFRNLRRLRFGEKLWYLGGKARYAPRKMKSFVWRRIHRLYRNLNRDLPRLLRDVTEFNSLAARNYIPQVYDGKVTLFWASGDLRAYDLVDGWKVLATGGIEVHEIPGTHLNIIKEPHVAELARKLNDCLARVQGRQLRVQELAPDDYVITSAAKTRAA
jgi:amino acid adenylation domain-containing protein